MKRLANNGPATGQPLRACSLNPKPLSTCWWTNGFCISIFLCAIMILVKLYDWCSRRNWVWSRSSKREWDWKGPPPQQVSELRSVSFFLLIIHVQFPKVKSLLSSLHSSIFLQGIQVKSNCIPSYKIYRIDKSVPWRSPWCRKGQRCQKWYSTHTISAHVHGECGLLLCLKVCLKKNMSVGFQCQISFLTNSNIQPLWA